MFAPISYALEPGEGERFGHELVVKLCADDLAVALLVVHAGAEPAAHAHVHEDTDEAWYVVSGSITAHVGEERFTLGPGGFAFLPRGVAHRFVVEGSSASLLVIGTGAGVLPPGDPDLSPG